MERWPLKASSIAAPFTLPTASPMAKPFFGALKVLNDLNNLNVLNNFFILWLPPAAESSVKLDDSGELRSARARELELGIKEILIGDQHFEIIGEAGIVALP